MSDPTGGAAGGRAAQADQTDPTPRSRGGSTALRVAQVVFVVAVAFFIVRYLRRAWPAVHAHEWELHPEWLVVSAALVLAYYLLNGLVWWLILRGCGLPAAATRTLAVWAKSILARYLPGNVFMFVSRGWMSYRQGLDVDRVSAGMVYEQVLNVAGALVVAAALFPFWTYEREITAWALLAIPLGVAVLHPRLFAPLAAYAALWLLAGLAMWTFAAAVTDVTAASYPELTVGFAVAFVAGMVVFFVPSGIGVREAVLAAATAGVFASGGVALAWALLARLWQTCLELGFVAGVSAADRLGGRPPSDDTAPAARTAAATADREER